MDLSPEQIGVIVGTVVSLLTAASAHRALRRKADESEVEKLSAVTSKRADELDKRVAFLENALAACERARAELVSQKVTLETEKTELLMRLAQRG